MLQMLSCTYEGRQGKGDVMFRRVRQLAKASKIIMDAIMMASMDRIRVFIPEHADAAQGACA